MWSLGSLLLASSLTLLSSCCSLWTLSFSLALAGSRNIVELVDAELLDELLDVLLAVVQQQCGAVYDAGIKALNQILFLSH